MKKMHLFINNKLIYSFGNKIFYEGVGEYIRIQTILPNFMSIIKRFIRNDIHSVKYDNDTLIVIIKKKILFFKDKKQVCEMRIDKGSRPLRLGVEIYNGFLYYGDYWGNINSEPVNIYRVNLSNYKKEIFYTFRHIRHIHFIQKDIYNPNKMYIGTGDSDKECGIYLLNIITKEITTIVEGSQKFRAVSILQVKNKLFWGSDNPDGDNYVYSFDRESQEVIELCKIDGPAYYSTINKKGELFIATTVEDRKKHKAIIYKSSDFGLTWNIYIKFKKDIWHTRYFGYGIVEFIEGQEQCDDLLYNLIGLRRLNE